MYLMKYAWRSSALPDPIVWEAPYVMSATSGETTISNRNFLNTNYLSAAAYSSASGGDYVFENCRFDSRGNCWAPGNGNIGVRFINCYLLVRNTLTSTVANKRVISGYPARFDMQHCTLQGGGMRFDDPLTKCLIRYNKISEVNGVRSNGVNAAGWAGYQVETTNANVENRPAIQFVGQPSGNGTNQPEIAWNRIVNVPAQSRCEDLINFFGGGGSVSGSPMWVHHNLLYGSTAQDPLFRASSGRGVLFENYAGGAVSYIDIEDNWIARTLGSINLANGDYRYINIRRNKMFYSGKWLGSNMPGSNYACNADGVGIYQVWADNEYSWNAVQNATALPFINNSANTGNSLGTGWNQITSTCSEAQEEASIAAFDAAALAAGHTQIGSTIAPWWAWGDAP